MGEWGAKPGIEIPVVPRAGTQLCSGTGPGEGKPGRVFSSGAPKTSRGCCWCHGHWENKVPCPQSLTGTPMPPRTPLCPCPPGSLAALPSHGQEAVLRRGGLFPAPKTGHQLGVGGRLVLQLLLSGQVEQDFQYMGGDIK